MGSSNKRVITVKIFFITAKLRIFFQSACSNAQKPVHCNAQMNPKLVREYCTLDANGDKLLSYAMDKMGLSARAYDRILKVARTIADLEGSEAIQTVHLSEAIGYRSLDREDWIG